MNLEPVIGLEIHVQPKTKTKMFCACANVESSTKPNTAVCPICLGHPGVLPVVNKQAIEFGIKASLALNLNINSFSKFDRKSYFYPDLPKGYQISQYDEPLAEDGYVEFFVGSETAKIRIERLHLEEDAAKNIHENNHTLVDYNRGGTPLMEIVTYPDIASPEQAKLFLQELRLIMRSIGVSDADMEKGQLRCDANISLRPAGDTALYPKTEIKNLNSFKSVEKALQFEVVRQSELWQKGNAPDVQATRGWNEQTQETVAQRTKEEASDYRYFPEPDIPPVVINPEQLELLQQTMPELPQATRMRLLDQYSLRLAVANSIVQDKALTSFVEQVISEFIAWLESRDDIEGTSEEIWEANKIKINKLVSGWVLSKLLALVNAKQISFAKQPITAENFAEFLTLIFTKQINSANAQKLLEAMFVSGDDPSVILDEQDLLQSSDSGELEQWVSNVIREFPDQVEQYRGGKETVLKFLLGMVMKQSKGKADPVQAEEQLRNQLS